MAVALLVAAGSGERLGAGRPKAFVVLAGRPMLAWSIEAMRAAGIDEIVVALPRVPPEHFPAALQALAEADCAIAAAPVTDTVKEAGPDRLVTATLDRTRLWAIQTPQAFRRGVLERALAVDP